LLLLANDDHHRKDPNQHHTFQDLMASREHASTPESITREDEVKNWPKSLLVQSSTAREHAI
jgi:predicted GIY-YIG superfamily endonuclease